MTLLRKYYDTGIEGGGIPDEVSKKVQIWVKPIDSLIDCFNDYEDQIARLKEENDRLRGALSELYDVVYKGDNVFKSLDKAHEVLNKPNITIVQSTPSPTKK